MAKGKTALGAFIGAIISAGILVLMLWLSSSIGGALTISLIGVSWLIGGFISGLIVTSPGKGALSGFICSIFMFLINGVVIVLLTVVTGAGFFSLLFEVLTLGLYEPTSLPESVIILMVLIGLLIAVIVSSVAAIFMVIGGAIGGAIRNPNRGQKGAYRDYPAHEEEFTTKTDSEYR